ncbi:MAG TPA: glutathione S-transferase N-terminal domain-containing protein [Stellaceae bacterium]|nr:glutathione S-transferase N-terminal domain-containing protein [Stellaceae bacterium]
MSASPLRLYELVLGNGISASPFVWRVRFALAHKGLAAEAVSLGFTEIPTVLDGRFKTVPILEMDDEAVVDSWAIADRLDEAFPERPRLFAGPGERAMVQFFDDWFMYAALRPLFSLYALDIHDAAKPCDQAYFRQSREDRVGRTLEEFVAGREKRVPKVRDGFEPIRRALARTPFLGGETPNYADYIALGALLWVSCVATMPLFEPDDPMLAWFKRGTDLYGGLGQDPRLRPLDTTAFSSAISAFIGSGAAV